MACYSQFNFFSRKNIFLVRRGGGLWEPFGLVGHKRTISGQISEKKLKFTRLLELVSHQQDFNIL